MSSDHFDSDMQDAEDEYHDVSDTEFAMQMSQHQKRPSDFHFQPHSTADSPPPQNHDSSYADQSSNLHSSSQNQDYTSSEDVGDSEESSSEEMNPEIPFSDHQQLQHQATDSNSDEDMSNESGMEDYNELFLGSSRDDSDPRAEFFRAINSFSQGASARDLLLAEVIQRLMDDGHVQRVESLNELEGLMANLDLRLDPYVLLETLNELGERMLMMNAITAERSIPSNHLARSLVSILSDPDLGDQLEVQLAACRCLYNFMEVNFDFIHVAVNHNAIEAVCKKLQEISYIDLTEQALQTLEMISRDPISHNQIVVNDGLKACLQYLDFLTVHSQRKCLLIVANACTNVGAGNFNKISPVFDDIAQVAQNYSDPNVLEQAWLSISRIVLCFKSHPDKLELLFGLRPELLKHMVATIVASANKANTPTDKVPVSFSTCLSLIKSLIVLASTSVSLSVMLVKDIAVGASIVDTVNQFKAKSDSNLRLASSKSDNVSIEAIMAAPKELLSQFLTLIGYLLPVNYTPQETPYLKNSHEEFEEKAAINASRIASYRNDIPTEFWVFVNDIWSLLINSFQALMDFEVRRKILINLFRIVNFLEPSDSSKITELSQVSGLLASIISHTKPILVKDAEDGESSEHKEDSSSKLNSNTLLLSSCLIVLNMIKIEPGFIVSFEKEGLFEDLAVVSKTLKSMFLIDADNEYETSRPFISMYSNKFADVEFSKDYEYKLTSSKIYNKLLHICDTIEELYLDSKQSVRSEASSMTAELLKDAKTLLEREDFADLTFKDWKDLWHKFGVLLDGSSSLSSFELISSGIIELLTSIFNTDELVSPGSLCYGLFISVFFHNNGHLISILVEKLQEALARSESFEIVSAGTNTAPNLRLSSLYYDPSQTAGMAKQIKIRLEDVSESPRLQGSLMILSVHAIATFASIDSFLKQRFSFFSALSGGFRGRSTSNDLEDVDPFDESVQEESSEEQSHIEFLINDEVIPKETTIYGAIYRALQSEPDEIVEPSKVWNTNHTISFHTVDTPPPESTTPVLYKFGHESLDNYDPTTIAILHLLKHLFEVNRYAETLKYNPISRDKFMSWKLSVKLNRQLEEPLVVASGTLPGWAIHVTRQFPFIFPLETRIFFLQSTSFGHSRLIHQWQVRTIQESEYNSTNNQRPQLGRPLRHKVRISRKLILQSALRVLNMYGSSPGVLEIEYFDEVGSGLGPTLEFYSSVSKEFSKRKLKLWRDDSPNGDEDAFIDYKTGLFPAPMDSNQVESENGKKVLYLFLMLGKFVARALLDSRIIDFKFNPLFIQVIQIFNSHSLNKMGFRDLKKITNSNCLRIVDPALADSLEYLMKYVEAYRSVPESKREQVTIDNCTLEDLALTFTLPGYPEYELIENGDETLVTPWNIESYITKVIEATLYHGIVPQTKAFMDGFSKVFPISSLVVFSPDELANLFGNAEEDWTFATLHATIHANHGYTKDSDSINMLIDTLVGFNSIEKRSFLQFLTGAPKLPIGGFKALKPEFTVVRKYPEGTLKDNDYLPSVMTCANYLKLPNYSDEETMKRKLLQAINEGADAFHLS